MENNKLQRAADNIRILAASMVEKAKSGHPGGAMGGADFINVLYTEFLRYDPDNLAYPHRDRMFLDPGHMSPMLYGVLALAEIMPLEELKAFRKQIAEDLVPVVSMVKEAQKARIDALAAAAEIVIH